jgi:hypothetical protein
MGRLYEDLTATWFWSITVMGPARHKVRTDGQAAMLEEAKADFQAAWEAFKAESGKRPPRR